MPHYQRIRDLREDADKTQTEIADHLGTTAQYYGKYEKGERELPFSRAVQLAEYYGVSLDYLAGRVQRRLPFTAEPFTLDQQKIAEMYALLTERNKGKLELFAEQLLASQDAHGQK